MIFTPESPESILQVQTADLLNLPSEEDDRYEYKSSKVKDKDLPAKISKAASGFWNSGGGVFIIGVDDNGVADGGVSLKIGRQARRDWIDEALSKLSPRGPYIVHSLEKRIEGCEIEENKAIFLIAFGRSNAGPHMSSDGCYYIRAGARTVRASHFIVEAMYARRGLQAPLIRHTLRAKPGNHLIIQLGIVVLNSSPALDVSLEIEPSTAIMRSFSESEFSISVPVISQQLPLFFDVHQLTMDPRNNPVFEVTVKYSDIAQNAYQDSFQVDIQQQMGPNLGGPKDTVKIEKALESINRTIQQNLRTVHSELTKISTTIKNKK